MKTGINEDRMERNTGRKEGKTSTGLTDSEVDLDAGFGDLHHLGEGGEAEDGKEGRKEDRKERRQEGRKTGRKERRQEKKETRRKKQEKRQQEGRNDIDGRLTGGEVDLDAGLGDLHHLGEGGRKTGRKEGRKTGREGGRKKGRKEYQTHRR